ncbi:YeeE/YedE family protein [Pediococcus acidilactici]|nr:YeeE/YedE family protein [Pediococcus acidilactici]UWF33880.1 YeeE/YedE family protein [Pediococcus acidilactici]
MLRLDRISGFILFLILLVGAPMILPSNMHFIRLLLGLALGYILSRSYTGFAGSVNRAYKNGSTKLMRTMMFMFFITALANVSFLMFTQNITMYALWVNPINLGLLIGGILFGIGMSFSSCCASGVLTDLATDAPRAGVTLIFFCIGVFIGFPFQVQSWVKNSWWTSPTGTKFANGVYMPDLFKWDGMNGYLGAVVLTALLAGLVIYLSYLYEKKRKLADDYHVIPSENVQDHPEDFDAKTFSLRNEETYRYLLEKPWTLKQGAFGMMIVFVLMMGITRSGWGASTPYGLWMGKLLNVFGVSDNALSQFAHLPAGTFSAPLLSNPVTVQNFGIFLGTLIYILTSGLLKKTLHATTSLTLKSASMFAAGGLAMGFGTRLSNGCNVGALYSPIAQFSISGWIFLAFLVAGGVLGNMFAKRVYA